MKIIDLRILPPVSVGRLGSSSIPLEAYDLEVSEARPLNFRNITPKESLSIREDGSLVQHKPVKIQFTDLDNNTKKVRPAAPFLEVFAITDQDQNVLVPLTIDLLNKAGLSMSNISWTIDLANNKLYRRTEDSDDKITAKIININHNNRVAIEGSCVNFIEGKKLPLGHGQFILPTAEFPQIRFRFTPGPGKIYGASSVRVNEETGKEETDPLYLKNPETFLLYKENGPWHEYVENSNDPKITSPLYIFAGHSVQGGRKSAGYIDDECDGFISVELNCPWGYLKASASVCAGPPDYAPDSLPVRVVSDEIEQILYGPDRNDSVPIEEAENLIRRAFETVRLQNTMALNGNLGVNSGMSNMPSSDRGVIKDYVPIMDESLVDNMAVRSIHERVFNGISSGLPPWFESALRKPDEIGDMSDEGRRKMPAMMRGADSRHLTFTHRQINTIIKAAKKAIFDHMYTTIAPSSKISVNDYQTQLNYRALGNPYGVLPKTAISNCFPGLEFDFRNLWRRAFKGLTLLENDNLVIQEDISDQYKNLVERRLICVDGKFTLVRNKRTGMNLESRVAMEWSNCLVHVLQKAGESIDCYFTIKADDSEYNGNDTAPLTKEELEKDLASENPEVQKVTLKVNNIFKENSSAFSEDIVKPGDLTQGLCAPWQNDYRECSCHYWAASRPDFVNVTIGSDGLSKGDNWMSNTRIGSYIPDDRKDEGLISYDDLFLDWENELKFIIGGNDVKHLNDE